MKQTADECSRREPAARPAEFGSLDEEVARDLALLREFSLNRERRLAGLFGRTIRPNPMRDELIRLIVLALAEKEHRRVAFYVRLCAPYGTAPSVRATIDLLVHAGLVILVPDPALQKARLVVPTRKLVDFYNEQMPRLREEVLQLLKEQGHG